MRKVVGVLFAVAMVLPVGLIASRAGATVYIGFCDETATVTYSPPLPIQGDPTEVTPTVTMASTFTKCTAGLGITGGTATYTGTALSPENCDTIHPPAYVGTEKITWNTGQTTTLNVTTPANIGEPPEGQEIVSSGLFAGDQYTQFYSNEPLPGGENPGACVTAPFSTQRMFGDTGEFDALNGSANCAGVTCNALVAASATATAPGLSVTVSGMPAVGVGTVQLNIASGSVSCPSVPTSVAPIAHLTDTGFAPTDRLTVTATFSFTASTSPEQVCFNSTLLFKSVSSPTVAKLGPALLLTCVQTTNVTPCVQSSSQVDTSEVVTFVVPGGDPTFSLVEPTGRQLWLSSFHPGKVGVRYSTYLQAKGGKAPTHWSKASGQLPPGCILNPTTGVITGTPTTKGKFTFVVQATDSEKPPKIAKMRVPLTVT